MVLIIEINCITNGLSDSQKKQISALTAKDKFILICEKNATVSMDILEMFMDLKVKPQFIKLDLNDEFALGFEYGQLAMTYSKEKKVVFSAKDRSNVFGKLFETAKTPAARTQTAKPAAKPAEKAPVAKEAPAKAAKPAKTAKIAAPKAKMTEEVNKTAPVSEEKTVAKTKIRLKDLSNESLLRKYPALEPYRIGRMGEGMIQNAIRGAKDADTGFKLQLTMLFGAEDGEKIWKILKKDYPRLKEMA